MALTQQQRSVAIATPLGDDTLVLESMSGDEELGRPFVYELSMLSEKEDIDLNDLLGQNVTVRVALSDGETRYFNGFVSSAGYVGIAGRYVRYRATLQPWIWFLSRSSDCRIFQGMSVPDIIKDVFREHGFTDFEDALCATYHQLDYCVQYRETDLDFVTRLMEHEGVYFFFRHENGKHTLVLADAAASHTSRSGYDSVPYFPPGGQGRRERDHLDTWAWGCEVQTGVVALGDYDFERPRSNLRVRSSANRNHAAAGFMRYDYPGKYTQMADGEFYARIRIEEHGSEFERIRGAGDVRGLSAGDLFKLTDFPVAAQNREYLLLAAHYEVQAESHQIGGSGDASFRCEIEVLNSQVPFRLARITPRSLVRGPQTATVTGPKGEEIHTDQFGRVKLLFHWDRYGQADENSSCWVRVSQGWAGRKWGAFSAPRVGQEVIVEFLEGDPDNPIVTGRVYNGSRKVPYDLPANKTISTLKSQSSKGGGGFNELRFEDKKDAEQVFLHAQKNLDLRVKNDRFETVLNDRHLVVGNDRKDHVKNDKHLQVDRHVQEKIGGDRNLKVVGKQAIAVDDSLSLTVSKDVSEVFKANHSEQVTKDLYIKAKNIVIEATTNITVKVGDSYLAIESGGVKIGTKGDIELDAKGNIKQTAMSKFDVKATGNATVNSTAGLTLKGTGPSELSSAAILSLKGAMIKLN